MKYRAEVDGIRALAVLPVVLYHAGVPPFSGGFVGVDVFFVISGFLITSMISAEIGERRFSIVNFYERRIRRIFPALFALMLGVMIASLILMLPDDLRRLSRSAGAAAFFVSNILFWKESGYFADPGDTKPLLHTWSLAVEEQFYIFFPLFLMFMHRFLPGRLRAGVLVLALLSFAACIWGTMRVPDASFYLIVTRAWELMVGAWLALGSGRQPAPKTGEFCAVAGLGLMAWAIFGFGKETPFPGAYALAPCIGTALLIYGAQPPESRVGALLRSRPFIFFGLISYSLYLWHWPLMVFSRYVAMRELNPAETVGVIAASVLLAWLSWKFIEAPFRKRDGMFRRPGLFAASAAVMAGFAAFAIGGTLSAGWPQRLPERMEPALAEAGSKLRNADRSRCMLDLEPGQGEAEEAISLQSLCRLGDAAAAPSFLLWGDSHAESVRAAMELEAQRSGAAGVFVGATGCPPILGVERYDQGKGRGCERFNEQVMTLLRDNPSIRSVVLLGRWALLASGKRYGLESGTEVALAPDGISGNAAIFDHGMTRTVQQLVGLGRMVYLVSGVPEVGVYVPQALLKAQWYGRPTEISPTTEAYLARNAHILGLFNSLAGEGVKILHPYKTLCSSERCAVEQGGVPLYADEHHLSVAGARAIHAVFEPVFWQNRGLDQKAHAADGSAAAPAAGLLRPNAAAVIDTAVGQIAQARAS